jgi:hypothetical protein
VDIKLAFELRADDPPRFASGLFGDVQFFIILGSHGNPFHRDSINGMIKNAS